MTMERRTFLKSSALGAGVALLEGCARRDVEYLVQPLERPEGRPGEGVWKPSVCGQCAAGCGTLVRVVDGDPRKVEGARTHPVNHGGLCALGQAALQGHYDPDRVTVPLLRPASAGPRDARDPLAPATWEQALERAAEAIARAAVEDPSSIVFVDGSGGTFLHALLARLAAALGAPAPIALTAPQEEVERRAAEIVLGWTTLPAYDLSRSDYVLSIGPAFLDRGHQPAWSTWAMSRVRGGTPGRRGKLVQAESRMSQTAAFADEWLPVMPGAEGTLARAIAEAVIEEAPGRGDADAYHALFASPPPTLADAAARCGVAEATLRRVARELAAAERPVVLAGGSAALLPDGLHHTVAALALDRLIGAVGREGGVFPSASFAIASALHPEGVAPPPALGELEARLRGEAGTPPRVVVVCEGDPVHVRPAARGWRAGLDRVETVIALAAARDDTTLLADVVLPVHSDVERFQAVEPRGLVFPVLSVAEPAVEPLGDSRHPGDVVLALATALERGAELPWETFQAVVEQAVTARAAELPGGGGDPSQLWRAALERGGLWSETGLVPGATSAAAAAAPAPIAEPAPVAAGENDLTLLLFESPKYGDGRGSNKPWLQELPDTLTTVMWSGWAELATRDADRLGIATGDLVELTTEHGSIEAPAVLRPEARPGTVALPLGPGYRDYGRYARGRGRNPLDLVGIASVAGTTAPALSGVRVQARRLGPGRLALFGRGLRQAEHIPVGWAPMEHGRSPS
jgi:anaerobic selenocysteine-containing dehydrogenase